MHKSVAALALGTLLALINAHAQAADRTVILPLKPSLDAASAAGKLDGTVRFYLAGTATPKGRVVYVDVVTNKKGNAFAKTDEETCFWTAQSALIQLQDAAKQAGANAVTNIVSFYKKKEFRSPTDFECHAGAVVSGVALKADLVILP